MMNFVVANRCDRDKTTISSAKWRIEAVVGAYTIGVESNRRLYCVMHTQLSYAHNKVGIWVFFVPSHSHNSVSPETSYIEWHRLCGEKRTFIQSFMQIKLPNYSGCQ